MNRESILYSLFCFNPFVLHLPTQFSAPSCLLSCRERDREGETHGSKVVLETLCDDSTHSNDMLVCEQGQIGDDWFRIERETL